MGKKKRKKETHNPAARKTVATEVILFPIKSATVQTDIQQNTATCSAINPVSMIQPLSATVVISLPYIF